MAGGVRRAAPSADVRSGASPITELCAAYGISRKTGYKWLARYEAGGLAAFADQPRRPHTGRNGGIRWHTRWVNVSQTLGGEWIGLVEIDDAEWDVYFGPLRLGRFHERTLQIEDALGRRHRRPY